MFANSNDTLSVADGYSQDAETPYREAAIPDPAAFLGEERKPLKARYHEQKDFPNCACLIGQSCNTKMFQLSAITLRGSTKYSVRLSRLESRVGFARSSEFRASGIGLVRPKAETHARRFGIILFASGAEVLAESDLIALSFDEN